MSSLDNHKSYSDSIEDDADKRYKFAKSQSQNNVWREVMLPK